MYSDKRFFGYILYFHQAAIIMSNQINFLIVELYLHIPKIVTVLINTVDDHIFSTILICYNVVSGLEMDVFVSVKLRICIFMT